MKDEKIYVSKRQKILGIIALGGLFACGLMVGLGFSSNKNPITKNSNERIEMTEEECAKISRSIVYSDNLDAEKLKALTLVYENNCAGRMVVKKEKLNYVHEVEKLSEETCEAVEELLLRGLGDESNADCGGMCDNVRIYMEVIKKGCSENRGKYVELLERSQALAHAVCGDMYEHTYGCAESANREGTTCEKVEREILERISSDCSGVNCHLDNAKWYAILAERGCAGNHDKYVDMTSQELYIARALQDDKFSEGDTIEIVETYKRINMEQAAKDVFEKMQKLTNPAIDFILQVEKIINE